MVPVHDLDFCSIWHLTIFDTQTTGSSKVRNCHTWQPKDKHAKQVFPELLVLFCGPARRFLCTGDVLLVLWLDVACVLGRYFSSLGEVRVRWQSVSGNTRGSVLWYLPWQLPACLFACLWAVECGSCCSSLYSYLGQIKHICAYGNIKGKNRVSR